MVRQSPNTLEALKLRLISNVDASADPLLTRDGIRYLIKALMYADASFSAEIESVLVKAGAIAIPELIKGLTTDNLNVRSVSAMALVRLGPLAEEAVLKAYARYSKKASVRWVLQFICQELCLDLPEEGALFGPLRPLERAI